MAHAGTQVQRVPGGSVCGRIRYALDGGVQFISRCRCSMCRKAHGAAFGSFLHADAAGFRWLAGEADVRRYESSPGTFRAFCGTCAASVPEVEDDGTHRRRRIGVIHTASRVACACLAALVFCAGASARDVADPASDAPEQRFASGPVVEASTHAEALARWRNADDVNAWIAAHFRYDTARAFRLSETQRQRDGRLAIHAPDAFFASGSGVCVDLARFAVETLHHVDRSAKARYLMIEFDPVTLAGNTLRRHWLAAFERDGARWFFADSKRPGHVAGPYPDTASFVADYARYRGRAVVAWREADSYQRRERTPAGRREAQDAR